MRCTVCNGIMDYIDTYERGRHVREIYICSKCKKRREKRVKTLPDMSRRKF